LVSADEVLRQIGSIPGLAKALERLGIGDAPTRGEAAAGVEFILEGLYLTRRMSKAQTEDGRTLYGSKG
jgi:magnesium chelatase subunit I